MQFTLYIFVFSGIHPYKECIETERQKLFFFVICLPGATEVLRKAGRTPGKQLIKRI